MDLAPGNFLNYFNILIIICLKHSLGPCFKNSIMTYNYQEFNIINKIFNAILEILILFANNYSYKIVDKAIEKHF